MSIWDRLGRVLRVDIKETKDSYGSTSIGNIEIPAKLTDLNAFAIANSLSEVNFPIDLLADRASKLRFYIADKNGKEVLNSELNRLINDINPFYSFNELFYHHLYSLLADGNSYGYRKSPSLYSTTSISVNNITRLDILQPNLVELTEFLNISTLDVSSTSDLLRRALYCDNDSRGVELNLDNLIITPIDNVKRPYSKILARSPQFKAERNINNTLATYSARYNVYANNGAAGYLVKKSAPSNDVQAIMNPTSRDKMLEEINNRNGITGKRNFWGISSIPIEFINTLSSIKDLMPFDETLANAICIGGVYQIPSNLIPRSQNSTFENQSDSERTIWENSLISLVDSACKSFTKMLTLDKISHSIKADYSNVGALKSNALDGEAVDNARLENLKLIKEIDPLKNIGSEIDKILLSYEERRD